MDPIASIKHAPKWAWFTVAGVGVGVGALKLLKNRTTAAADAAATTDNPDPTTTGDPTYATAAGSSTGVIVPPVIVSGGDTDQSGTGLGDLQDLYVGGVSDLLTQEGQAFNDLLGKSIDVTDSSIGVTNSVTGLLSQTVGTLGDLATIKAQAAQAGSAPAPASQAAQLNPAYVAAGMPPISDAFAAQANAAGPDPGDGSSPFWNFIHANGG